MPKRPRLLILLNRLAIGGPAVNTLALAAALSNDFEILLVAGEPQPHEQSAAHLLQQHQGFAVQMLPAMKRSLLPLSDWKAYRSLRAIIQQFQPHIVHTHGTKPGVLGRLAAASCGVPVVLHTFHGHVFRGYFPAPVNAAVVVLERWLATKSTALIAINEQLRNDLLQRYRIAPASKVVLNRLGIDWQSFQDTDGHMRSSFRQELGLRDTEVVVASIGRLVPIKNLELYMEVIATVLEATPQSCRFLVVGGGEERERLQQRLQQLHIGFTSTGPEFDPQQPVIFTSWRTDMQRVLAGIDVLVLTSLNEGTPVSVMEALAAGKPVVSTPVGGVPELLQASGGGETGTCVHELAEKVQHFTAGKALRTAAGSKGREFVKSRLSIDNQVIELSNCYRQLLQQASHLQSKRR